MSDQHRWQVSGTAAEKYERFVASWFTGWAADLVSRAGIERGWSVLDLACGTGVVTRALGPVVGPTGAITASDLNEGMLTQAQEHEVQGAAVVWHQADAEQLPFDDAQFDAVLCQQGLQFVPHKPAAVSEMKRVLKPGGVVAVSVWRSPEHNPYIAALAEGLSRYVSAEAGQIMLAPCGLGDPDELAELFADAGFGSVRVEAITLERDPTDAAEAVEGNLAALPIADEIGALDPATHAQMIDSIVAALDDYIADGMLRAPNSANIATAIA